MTYVLELCIAHKGRLKFIHNLKHQSHTYSLNFAQSGEYEKSRQ